MLTLVAFIRAINVGGHNVTMAELRWLFGGPYFKDVETFIASGNVIFESRSLLLPERFEETLWPRRPRDLAEHDYSR